MKSIFTTCAACVLAIFCTFGAQAQTQAPTSKPTPTAATPNMVRDNSLYLALGERTGLAQLSDDFVNRLMANKRMRPFFEKTNLPHFKLQLTDQFCVVSGGPCVYKGADMKSSHADFDIAKADFNVLVEVLQQAMDAKNIPFRVQNRLLALLAPMHKDVITVQ
jgi:hemoglobin